MMTGTIRAMNSELAGVVGVLLLVYGVFALCLAGLVNTREEDNPSTERWWIVAYLLFLPSFFVDVIVHCRRNRVSLPQ